MIIIIIIMAEYSLRLIDFTIEIIKCMTLHCIRCYTQHALRPFIDSEANHIRSFIKIPFINIGIDFIDLPSIFQDKSVIQSIPIPTSKIQNILLFVTNIINQSEILFLISINLFLILISMLILPSLEIVKIQNMFINQPDI